MDFQVFFMIYFAVQLANIVTNMLKMLFDMIDDKPELLRYMLYFIIIGISITGGLIATEYSEFR